MSVLERSPAEKKQYRIKSKEHGVFFVSFSQHARQRLEERGINLIEAIASLSTHSEKLIEVVGEGEVAFLDSQRKLSILLSVSASEGGFHYLNVITTLNDIPRDQYGVAKFDVDVLIEV